MRAYVPKYEMRSAASLDEGLAILADAPGEWTPLAGGTDLMVLFTAGALPPGRYLDIHRLRELRGVERTAVGARDPDRQRVRAGERSTTVRMRQPAW